MIEIKKLGIIEFKELNKLSMIIYINMVYFDSIDHKLFPQCSIKICYKVNYCLVLILWIVAQICKIISFSS